MVDTLRPTLGSGGWLACGLALIAVCCGDGGIPTPTSPTGAQTAPTAGQPAPTQASVRGSVQDPAGRWLVGARVEALDGPSAGTSAIVGGNGIFDFFGSFSPSTRFRASYDGHESLIDTPRCSVANCAGGARPWMVFYLRPLEAPIDLAGDYTLTLTAAATCSTLPSDTRSRSYPVTITRRFRENTADLMGFDVEIRSASVLESLRRFSIGVAGDYISLYLSRVEGEDPAVAEDLGANRYVAFTGETFATLNPASLSTIDLVFDGSIDVVTLRSPLGTAYMLPPADVISKEHCTSPEHRLVLSRTR
jgi:hypothetical protein